MIWKVCVLKKSEFWQPKPKARLGSQVVHAVISSSESGLGGSWHLNTGQNRKSALSSVLTGPSKMDVWLGPVHRTV